MKVGLNNFKGDLMKNTFLDVRKGLLMLEEQNQNFDSLDMEKKLEIINFALTESVSVYWPNLALSWIEKNPNIISAPLQAKLLESMNKPWAKHEFKQKIKRILKNNQDLW